MAYSALTFIILAVLGPAIVHMCAAGDAFSILDPTFSWNESCQRIATSVSKKSNVYHVASVNYLEDIVHWASSSTQFAACSFEPGTPEDVGIALQLLGQTRTPFAVKGGGHATNPGFSSTKGVHISMSRFHDVEYDPAARTVRIGAGLLWDDIYSALEPHGVNVVGGRVSGVGVAGFILGGGYSWLTNQYGLTIDTVQAFQLVVPNGTVIDVNETSNPDLFFALKGGLNNFVWYRNHVYAEGISADTSLGRCTDLCYGAPGPTDTLNKISQATANFAANNRDPQAVIITSYNYLLGLPIPTVILFYDAPTCPPGTFDEFLAIEPSVKDVGTRSFPAFVQSIPQYQRVPTRAAFNSISLTNYPLSLLEVIAGEAKSWAEKLWPSVFFINYDVEPFLPDFLSHNTTPSAYPPDRTRGFFPLEIYYSWNFQSSDQTVYDAIRETVQTIQAHAVKDGQDIADAAVYPNYAIFDTPLVKLYGANLPRLQAIKKAVDPENVMSLAGGFKL